MLSECDQRQLDELKRAANVVAYEVAALNFYALMYRLEAALKCAALEREEKFSPSQLRIPAGQTGGGQWTSGGGSSAGGGLGQDSVRVQPAFVQVAPIVVEKAAEAAIYLYLYLTSRNSADATAVLEFNAREFLPGATEGSPAISVRQLTREEVDASCPRHGQV